MKAIAFIANQSGIIHASPRPLERRESVSMMEHFHCRPRKPTNSPSGAEEWLIIFSHVVGKRSPLLLVETGVHSFFDETRHVGYFRNAMQRKPVASNAQWRFGDCRGTFADCRAMAKFCRASTVRSQPLRPFLTFPFLSSLILIFTSV